MIIATRRARHPRAAEVAVAEGLAAGPVSGETVRATLARLGER